MRWRESDKAEIGYKIKIGDWVVMTPSFIGGKSTGYRVTKVKRGQAICEIKGRDALKFPGYYTHGFQPLQKKTKPDYVSPNTWHVRVNPDIKRFRLRYD